MHGNELGFVIWVICSLLFVGIGIRCFFAKTAVGFWAGIREPEVSDVSGYNRAVGYLWIGFGIYFILTGIPLLLGGIGLIITVTMLGSIIGCIGLMMIYTIGITRKYGVRQK